jgi:hypothetical protein
MPPTSPSAALEPSRRRSILGGEVASGFEVRGGVVQAVIPADARRGVARTASVRLPVRAGDPVWVEDDVSRISVSFAVRGATDVPVTTTGGIAVYSGALAGADLVHRVHAEGTEDFVVFEGRPGNEEIAYDVDVSRVAGLRLQSNTLEFLDDGGSPRLRVAPPYVVDANGGRAAAALALEGCGFDSSPVAPWGRVVTPAGAAHCRVRVSWKAAIYPAMVDPNWTATGSMASARIDQTATLLSSGHVLVAGGGGPGPAFNTLATAELYDPTTGTFATTGSMVEARQNQTATLLGSGDVLVVGGCGDSDCALVDLYDPTTGTFALTGSTIYSRIGHTATLLGSGKVLVAGGCCDGLGNTLYENELYDPTAGTFTVTGSMATAREQHTATLLASGEVLAAGGNGGSGYLASAELYNPTTATFSATGSMVTARELHTATLLASGVVLVVAGDGASGYLSSAELYNPAAGTFGVTGSLPTAEAGQTATLLGSGDVLIAGGITSLSPFVLSSAALYDPTAGTFTATTAMTTQRNGHAAALLGSGAVLAAGGYDGTVRVSSAELFTCVTTCPAGDNCGTVPDGCGGTVSCGTCVAPQTCGGGGTANVCGCTALTKCPAGDNCGAISDGCTGTVICGPKCTAPKTCGGGGTPNVCGCTPFTTCPAGDDCGTVPDGCGGTLGCGTCTAPKTCAGGGTPNVCGCKPLAACPPGDDCGTVADGCGGTLSCGTCGGGRSCAANHCVDTDAGTDAGAKDSGIDASDSGVGAKDSGTGGNKDAGAVGQDSGPTGDATTDGPDGGGLSGQSAGCSCRTAQRREIPTNALLWVGGAGMVGMRRLRRRFPRR